ncbi:MAG: carbohydrate kinase [Acidimicrobiia bacterium]|nr:carbohydrate kinase [Acidimicrobiia bacterium]
MRLGLGIDVGSTNVKVALVDGDGGLLAASSGALAVHRRGDSVVQDPVALWDTVCAGVREVLAERPEAAQRVVTVGVCSQYSSVVPVDADAEPVGDLVMYLDQRGTPHSWAILERLPEAFELWIDRHGIPPIGGGLTLGHLLALQHDDPEQHERTAAYLEPMDYVVARLTGELVANQCTMFTSQLCDNRHLGGLAYDEELVAGSGVDPSRLPRLVGVVDHVGTLRPGVAAALGLSASVVVTAPMNDSHAGAYATGAFEPRRAGLAMGTTSVLLDTVDAKATDLDHEVLAMPSPEPDRYLVWAENGIGGKALQHLLEELVLASDVLGDHRGDSGFAALEEALAASPPGAGGVLFLPWLAGTMSPRADGRMRGGFVNLSLETRRVDLVRAAVEGTAYNVGWLLPVVERFSGAAIDEVAFVGGAARSAGWAQTLADVLNRPILPVERPEVAVARAVAGVALHRFDECVGRPDPPPCGPPVAPRPEVHERLRTPQAQFVALFDALRPVYHALNG